MYLFLITNPCHTSSWNRTWLLKYAIHFFQRLHTCSSRSCIWLAGLLVTLLISPSISFSVAINFAFFFGAHPCLCGLHNAQPLISYLYKPFPQFLLVIISPMLAGSVKADYTETKRRLHSCFKAMIYGRQNEDKRTDR